MEGKWPCYTGGQFNGIRMVRRWSVLWRENGHFTEVLTLMVMLGRWPLREEEWSLYGGSYFNGGRKVLSEGQRWSV